MNVKSKYVGKFFSVLGDSISTLSGSNPPEYAVFYDWERGNLSGVFTPADTWWGQVIGALGGRLLVNNSYSGSMVCKHPLCEIESYGCSDARTGFLGVGDRSPDVVMILLGLNDWGNGMRIASVDGETGLDLFSVAYKTMLAKIKRNYPYAEIWCLTLPRSQWSRSKEYAAPLYHAGIHIDEYCEAIRACGKAAGCTVVDIACPDDPYDTIDGYHPTAVGMQTIATAVLRGIEAVAAQDAQ